MLEEDALVCWICSPTLWDVAAHHRHVALVYEVPDRHLPASCSAFASVAAPFSCQVFDVDVWICFLHHSNGKVRCTQACGNSTALVRSLITHVKTGAQIKYVV